LADPYQIEQAYFVGEADAIADLVAECAGFASPELIDDGETTTPSKRIISHIPGYAGLKATAGPLIAQAIGIVTLRNRCRHFREWLDRLIQLGGG